MKKLLLCLLLILLPSVVMAQKDFMYKDNITWGMKQNQLESLEKPAMHQNDYSYVVDTGTNMEGLDTTLWYFFTLNDKLAQIAEIFDNYDYKRVPINNYTNYSRIRGEIVARFGPPLRERTIWLDLSAKNRFNNDDIAAMIAGKAEIVSVWDLPDTDIMLTMNLNNQERVRIIAVYQSKQHIDTYFTEDAERQKSGTARSY